MFSNIGLTEILIIALVILIFFGGKKIPEFIRGLGTSVKEFKKGMSDDDEPKRKKSDDSEE